MKKRRSKAKDVVDASAWTGDLDARPVTKRRKEKPLSKVQILLGMIIIAFVTIFSWTQIFQLFATGTIYVRRGGPATLDERPLAFVIAFIISFGWAAASVWVCAKLAMSSAIRKKLANRLKGTWRRVP